MGQANHENEARPAVKSTRNIILLDTIQMGGPEMGKDAKLHGRKTGLANGGTSLCRPRFIAGGCNVGEKEEERSC